MMKFVTQFTDILNLYVCNNVKHMAYPLKVFVGSECWFMEPLGYELNATT